MPPLPSPGNIIRVQFNTGDGASIEAGSRYFLSYTGAAPSGGVLDTLADDVASGWNTHIAPFVLDAEALHGVVCTDLSSAMGAEGTWTGTYNGTSGSAAQLPANIAACMVHSIPVRYRGGHPRTYLRCGSVDDLTSPNEWDSTRQGVFNAGWAAWIAAILGTSGLGITLTNIVSVNWYKGFTAVPNPVTGKTKYPAKLNPDGPQVYNISSTSCATKLGSQRRRLDI